MSLLMIFVYAILFLMGCSAIFGLYFCFKVFTDKGDEQ